MKFCVFSATLVVLLRTSVALNCYQCSGSDPTKPFQCNEWLSSDIDIQPQTCDNVYDAKYCIKHTGRFEDGMIHLGGIEPQSCDHVFEAEYCVKSTSLDGGIGAKRFCSSLDLGNYCNYVKQPGDILTYRTCVYTCSGDGCNPSSRAKPTTFLIFVPTLVFLYKLMTVVAR